MPVSATLYASAVGGTEPYDFAWVFGDGSTASGPDVTHAYATPGTFNVTVLVTDASGGMATSSVPIVVAPPRCTPEAVSNYGAGPSGSPLPILGVGFAAGAAVVLLFSRRARRRRRRPPPPTTSRRGGSQGSR